MPERGESPAPGEARYRNKLVADHQLRVLSAVSYWEGRLAERSPGVKWVPRDAFLARVREDLPMNVHDTHALYERMLREGGEHVIERPVRARPS